MAIVVLDAKRTMIADPSTVTATNHAYQMKRKVTTECHPITLEGAEKAGQQLARMVGDAVASNARKVAVKVESCPQGFFFTMEAWR